MLRDCSGLPEDASTRVGAESGAIVGKEWVGSLCHAKPYLTLTLSRCRVAKCALGFTYVR